MSAPDDNPSSGESASSNASDASTSTSGESAADDGTAASTNSRQRPSGRQAYRIYVATRRSQNHKLAHDEATPGKFAEVPDHPLVPCDVQPIVTTQASLDDMIAALRTAGSFAYDSEFIGEQSYFPRLCVLQVATTTSIWLIDPLADGLDLTPFWELFTDDAIEKIVHAGVPDLEPVMRFLGKAPVHVFDTQIAAAFAAMNYPIGLSALVQQFVGIDLGKGLKFSQWDQRPLSAVQQRYAADDVRYLPLVREALVARLREIGNYDAAMEECRNLSEPTLYRFDAAQQCARVRGSESLGPKDLAILRELVVWRDEQARQLDIPPRSLVRDESLVLLVRNPPADPAEIAAVRGMPKRLAAQHAPRIMRLIAVGKRVPAEQRPVTRRLRLTRSQQNLAEELWQEVQRVCAKENIDTSMVTNRRDLTVTFKHLMRGRPANGSRLLVGWRAKLIRDTLERFASGQIAKDDQTADEASSPDEDTASPADA